MAKKFIPKAEEYRNHKNLCILYYCKYVKRMEELQKQVHDLEYEILENAKYVNHYKQGLNSSDLYIADFILNGYRTGICLEHFES